MVYQNYLVACVKVNGQVLREIAGTVLIPFGSEYSIFLKNLNSVRAQVKVSVDGTEATDGTSLVIAPNDSIELERYIRHGNLEAGNRFKFIERTKSIERHRGIGTDDGLIRVEYKREAVVQDVPIKRFHYQDEWIPRPRPYPPHFPPRPYLSRERIRQVRAPAMRSMHPAASASGSVRSMSQHSQPTMDSAFGEAGITVAGGASNQRFVSVPGFATENHSDVIVLRLRGIVGDVIVKKAVTVNRKPTCATCGKVNKGAASFCSKCGTALSLI